MAELRLNVEELEQRIAPDLVDDIYLTDFSTGSNGTSASAGNGSPSIGSSGSVSNG